MMIRLTILVAALAVDSGLSACTSHDAAFRKSDHFDGKRFHNTASVPPESFSEDVKVAWELWRKPARWPKHFPTPQRDIADKVVSGGVKATFVGHATVLLQVGGLNILTDPVFFDSVGLNRVVGQRRVTNAGVKLESLPHIDAILISHTTMITSRAFFFSKVGSSPGCRWRIFAHCSSRSYSSRHVQIALTKV
jgi:hypothetical protein